MRAGLRLTDLLARLHVFTGPLPPAPAVERRPVVEREPVVEPVETTPTSQRTPGRVSTGSTTGAQVSTGSAIGSRAVASPLDDALTGLDPSSRASVLDPLGRSRSDRPRVGHPVRVSLPYLSDGVAPTMPALARQVDETTCGAAVLAMLAMAGDPWLALQVARDPARRFAALQHRVHRACSRTGPVPWPRRFGTAPWAAAAVARFGDTRYTHRVVDGARGAEVLAAAVAAASSGVPVPLFTGGDLDAGWQAAVPRHVVLLADARPDGAGPHNTQPYDAPDDARPDGAGTVGARPDGAGRDGAWPDGGLDGARPDGARLDDDSGPGGGSDVVGRGRGIVWIYEPSSATLHTVPTSTLLDPDAAAPRDRAALTAALGHWPHVVWALLPR